MEFRGRNYGDWNQIADCIGRIEKNVLGESKGKTTLIKKHSGGG